jgi:hypothetical protein
MPKTDIFVCELIDKVQHGELLLSEMQPRYVWPATRVRDLLDSLYRGYPSGHDCGLGSLLHANPVANILQQCARTCRPSCLWLGLLFVAFSPRCSGTIR